MADAILTLMPSNEQYEMIYSSLPKSVLDNWHTDFYGGLIVRYDKCTDKTNVLYKKIPVMLYKGHLYVWLCSLNAYQNIVLKSVSQYIPPQEEYGYLQVYSVDDEGKPYSVYVKVKETGDYGYTPCTFKLTPGNYHLEVIPSGWGITLSAAADVKANTTTKLTIKLPPQYFKAYGVKFKWPSDAEYAFAYKIWNPLKLPLDDIISKAYEYQFKFANYGMKLVGGTYAFDEQTKNGVIVFWLKRTESTATRAMAVSWASIAMFIVVTILVGILVYGWVTASRTKIEYQESYQDYTKWLEDEDARLDEQLKQGLISESTYKELVKYKHSTPPPSQGETDWGEVAKYVAIATGIGLGGALLLKGMKSEAVRKKAKEYVGKAKEYVGKLRGGENE